MIRLEIIPRNISVMNNMYLRMPNIELYTDKNTQCCIIDNTKTM